MGLSKKTKSFLSKAFMAAGAAPLLAGAGTILTGGLSEAFNTLSNMSGLEGALLGGGGLLLGGAACALAFIKAMDKGLLGKLDPVSGTFLLLVICPVVAITGGLVGATGAGKISEMVSPPPVEQQLEESEMPKAPAIGEDKPYIVPGLS